MTTRGRQGERDESVSLAPLTPEEALRALLAVKPEGEPRLDETDASNAGEENSSPRQ